MTIDKDDILTRIKKQGYWRVEFQPLVVDNNRINSLPKCQEIVKNARIQLNSGWDYPHYFQDSNNDKYCISNCNGYIESAVNFGRYKELWRMYRNAQFIHFFAMKEDYDNDDIFPPSNPPVISKSSLYVINTIYKFTEIYEFLRRLTKQGIYKEGVRVYISLRNTDNRKLLLDDPKRMPLLKDYVVIISEIKFDKTYTEKEISEEAENFALAQIIETLHRFNWNNPPEHTIKNDQKNFLERKI